MLEAHPTALAQFSEENPGTMIISFIAFSLSAVHFPCAQANAPHSPQN